LSVAIVAWLTGAPQREKPLWAAVSSDAVRQLESAVASDRSDPMAVGALAQAYLDAHEPGLAVALVERSSPAVRDDVRVRHTFARALLDQGRSEDALAVERAVLAACRPLVDGRAAAAGCDALLLALASRRADILGELVSLGVEDAQAHPEEARVAYQNATREARVIAQ
jgi:hypothetical protein